MTKNIKKNIYLRLEENHIQKIEEIAKKEDRSKSYIIRKAIIQYLNQKEEEKKQK